MTNIWVATTQSQCFFFPEDTMILVLEIYNQQFQGTIVFLGESIGKLLGGSFWLVFLKKQVLQKHHKIGPQIRSICFTPSKTNDGILDHDHDCFWQ